MNRSIGDSVLVAGACFFGSWTVLLLRMVLSESSFSDLRAWSFVPFVIALGIWACVRARPCRQARGIEMLASRSIDL